MHRHAVNKDFFLKKRQLKSNILRRNIFNEHVTKALLIFHRKKALSPNQAEQACWKHSHQAKQKYPSSLVKCHITLWDESTTDTRRTPAAATLQNHLSWLCPGQ